MPISIPYEKFTDDELQKITNGEAKADDIFLEKYATETELNALSDGTDTLEDSLEESEAEYPIVNEMHPDISTKERATIKNFGVDTQSAIEYLQTLHPKMVFSTSEYDSNQILIRKPNEKEFRLLDPEGVTSVGEFGRDVADIVWDVLPAGIAETAAGIGGGLLLGGLPGAIGAAGAAGAGLEAARQGIGKYLGVVKEIDPMQVGITGGLGAASTAILGPGGKAAAKGTTGLLSKAWDGAAPTRYWLAEQASGVPAEVLKYTRENLGKVAAYTKLGREGTKEYIKEATKRLRDTVGTYKSAVGKEVDTIKKSALAEGITANIAEVKNAFKKYIGDVENLASEGGGKGSGAILEKLDNAKSLYDHIFTQDVEKKVLKYENQVLDPYGKSVGGTPKVTKKVFREDYPDVVPVTTADAMRDSLDNMAAVWDTGKLTDRFGRTLSAAEKETKAKAVEGAQIIREELEKVLGKPFVQKKDQFREAVDMAKDVEEALPFRKDAVESLEKLDRPSKKRLLDRLGVIDEKLGTDIQDTVLLKEADKFLGKPGLLGVTGQNKPSAPRTTGAGALGASLGAYLGYATGGGMPASAIGFGLGGLAGAGLGGPAAQKKYMQFGLGLEKMNKAFLPGTQTMINSAWSGMNQDAQ